MKRWNWFLNYILMWYGIEKALGKLQSVWIVSSCIYLTIWLIKLSNMWMFWNESRYIHFPEKEYSKTWNTWVFTSHVWTFMYSLILGILFITRNHLLIISSDTCDAFTNFHWVWLGSSSNSCNWYSSRFCFHQNV